MSERIWFTSAQAAEHVGCHVDTVRKACESGELHGAQRKPNGRWRLHRDCIDAWAGGELCAHQSSIRPRTQPRARSA